MLRNFGSCRKMAKAFCYKKSCYNSSPPPVVIILLPLKLKQLKSPVNPQQTHLKTNYQYQQHPLQQVYSLRCYFNIFDPYGVQCTGTMADIRRPVTLLMVAVFSQTAISESLLSNLIGQRPNDLFSMSTK